jgi:hypothetical protein
MKNKSIQKLSSFFFLILNLFLTIVLQLENLKKKKKRTLFRSNLKLVFLVPLGFLIRLKKINCSECACVRFGRNFLGPMVLW